MLLSFSALKVFPRFLKTIQFLDHFSPFPLQQLSPPNPPSFQRIEALDVEVPDQDSLTQSGLFRFVEELAEVPAGVRPPPKGVIATKEDDKGKGPAPG